MDRGETLLSPLSPLRQDSDTFGGNSGLSTANSSFSDAELEKWESSIENIPSDLQVQYAPMVAGLMIKTRINLYKILDALGWSRASCSNMLNVLNRVGEALMPAVVDIGIALDWTRLPLLLNICGSLDEPQLSEFLTDCFPHITLPLIDIAYYLDDADSKVFIDLLHHLSVTELDHILKVCDEPFAKHCRLCRVRRAHAMEFRLHHDQLHLSSHAFMPGTSAFYDRSDMWSADDEKLFTFDTDRQIIYWRENEVDLMRICDKCADDVHRAAACVSRFREVYHISGHNRKELITAEREDEMARAALLHAIAKEVKRRRAREFAIRALKSHREGKLREEKEEEEKRKREAKQLALEEAKRKHASMIAKAASQDRKWLMQEVRANNKRMSANTDLAHLQTQPEYNLQNPFPALREHPHSWRLTPFHNGIPITSSAVIQRFGTGIHESESALASLQGWKEDADILYREYLASQEEKERLAKEAHDAEIKGLRDYVDKQFYLGGRQARLRDREAEQREEDRILERRRQRELRREARLAREEATAREMMSLEDRRSWQMRYDEKERIIIERELANMRFEEAQQTAIDSFWGIPTHIRNMKNKESQQRQQWRGRVDELRHMCVEVGIIKPFAWEKGKYRDRVTGKLIT